MNANRSEYLALKRLKENADYKFLEMKWLLVISDIQKLRDKAAAGASEGNWRYYAGQEKGAQRIVMALDEAILKLEAEDQALIDESKYDDLLNEIRGGNK